MADWDDDRERFYRQGYYRDSDWDFDRGSFYQGGRYGRMNPNYGYDRGYSSSYGRNMYDYDRDYGRGRYDYDRSSDRDFGSMYGRNFDYDTDYDDERDYGTQVGRGYSGYGSPFNRGFGSSYNRSGMGPGSQYRSNYNRSGYEYDSPYNRGMSTYGNRSGYNRYGRGQGYGGSQGSGSRDDYGRGFEQDFSDRDYDQDFYSDSENEDIPSYWSYTEYWLIPGPFSGMGPEGYQRSDDRIEDDVCERLTQHGQVDASDVQVEVKNGEVFLRGEVDNRQSKRMAEDTAESVSGVKEVHNELRVRQGVKHSFQSQKQDQYQGQPQHQGQSQSGPDETNV